MVKKLACLFISLLSLSAYGAEVTLKACASAEVTAESQPGAIRLSGGVSGSNERCIEMNLKSPVPPDEFSQMIFDRSDEQTLVFMWGGCNVSDVDVSYTVEFRWNYSIQTSVEFDETASAHISYDYADQDYTQGSGSFVEEVQSMLPAMYCVDGFPAELTASANVTSEYSDWRLRNDQGINGLFYDQVKPGHGFDVNVNKEGITIFYYGHTSDGERLWLISEPLRQDIEYYETLSLKMFEVAEGVFGAPVPVETTWGTLLISFHDCDSGAAVLDGIDGIIQLDLTRLAGLDGVGCG